MSAISSKRTLESLIKDWTDWAKKTQSYFMDDFAFSLKFLPEFMRDSTLALLTIIVGFSIALITRAVVSKLIPANSNTTNSPKYSEHLSIHQRVTRSTFWLIWSAFTVWGYSQLPLLSSSLSKWKISSENLSIQLMIGLGTVFLILCENWIKNFFEKIWSISKSIPNFKINDKLTSALTIIGFYILALAMGLELNQPEGFGLKFTATLLILFFGYFLGKLLKNAILSLMGTKNANYIFGAKLSFYFVFFSFLITAIEVWLI